MVWIISAVVPAVLALLFFAVSWYEKNHVRIREYEVEAKEIGEAFDGYTMVVMADLHDRGAGRRNNRMMASIRRIHPDAVMVAGDMVMARKGKCRYRESLRLMKRLGFRYPVYYGLGNHEERMCRERELYGEDYDLWYEEMMKAGVTVLDNLSLTLRDGKDALTITGLNMDKEYYARFHTRPMDCTYLNEILGVAGRDEYHILLAHSPAYFDAYTRWGADLILSGHYHGGTIRLPLVGGLVSPGFHLFPRYSRGMYRKRKGTMIVSGGLGTHSVNIRFGNMSELLVVKLKRVS